MVIHQSSQLPASVMLIDNDNNVVFETYVDNLTRSGLEAEKRNEV